jgi:hypothetical protein
MTIFKMLVALSATPLFADFASAQQIGVVGLYQNGAAIDTIETTNPGCNILRSGSIEAMQGKLTTPLIQPDRFVVMACEKFVLNDLTTRTALESLSKGGENIALFEGSLINFEEPASVSEASDRQYVLKLGYYNNNDLNARNKELVELGEMSSERYGVWSNEALLQVHRASGLATPDEVVVIYYDTPEIAEDFRDNNQDVLERVSAFNDAHLNGFTYLIGNVTP